MFNSEKFTLKILNVNLLQKYGFKDYVLVKECLKIPKNFVCGKAELGKLRTTTIFIAVGSF